MARAHSAEKAKQKGVASSSAAKVLPEQLRDSAATPDTTKGANSPTTRKRGDREVTDLEKAVKRLKTDLNPCLASSFATPPTAMSLKVGEEVASLMESEGDHDMFDKMSHEEVDSMVLGHISQVARWATASRAKSQKAGAALRYSQKLVNEEKKKFEKAAIRVSELETEGKELGARVEKLTRRHDRLRRRVGRRDRALAKETARANKAEYDFYMAGKRKILRVMKEKGLPYSDYLDNPEVDCPMRRWERMLFPRIQMINRSPILILVMGRIEVPGYARCICSPNW